MNLVEACMRYNRLVLLVTVALVALGIVGLKFMPKQEFPEFTIRQGLVVGVFPGATVLQVEEELAKPLERFLFTYQEVNRNKTYSISKSGMVFVMVELEDDVHNKDRVWNKIKLGLQEFKQKLTPEVLAIVAQDDFGDTSALLISIESDDKNSRELAHYMEQLEERLMKIKSVSNLRPFGVQQEQISIYLDKRKLIGYGIDQRYVMSQLAAQGLKTTGGKLDDSKTIMPIYISPALQTEQDIANQVIYMDSKGNTVRVKDIARVVREYPYPDSYIRNNGKNTVLLSLEMRPGYNIIEYGTQVEEVMTAFIKTLPPSVKIERIADQPKVVKESVYSFLQDLGLAIVIVVVVMLLLFPWRSAVIAAMTIPITIFISIGIMNLVGIPLNTVTLAALIVVLGMIVDNSIVVLDAYLENLDRGMSRWYAAAASASRYFGSIFLATLCISVIFFPFLFITKGMIRDFLNFFPWTICLTLMISVVVSMLMIPFLEFSIIKKGLKQGEKSKSHQFNLLELVQTTYEKALHQTMMHPWITVFFGLASLALAALILNHLDIRLMPKAERDQFAVEIYLPEGAALEQTGLVADSMQAILSHDERVVSVTTFVGMGSPRFQATYAPNLPSTHYGQFIVNTTTNETTVEVLDDYADKYAHYFPQAYVRFKQLDYNRVSIPIEIRFQGDDLLLLKEQGAKMQDFLRTLDPLTWVHINSDQARPAINVSMKPLEAAQMGISTASASLQLAMLNEGVTIAKIWEGDYSLPLKLKTEYDKHPQKNATIDNEYLNSHIPNVVAPLRQVATVDPIWEDGEIVRRTGMRTLNVLADFKRLVNNDKVQEQILAYVENEVRPNLPPGVTCEIGGLSESDKENLQPIMLSLLAALVLIFLFLLIDYKRIFISIISLVALSLCLLGAALSLLLSDLSISMTSVLGIVSLMGIVVRNVILITQHADQLRIEEKVSAFEAAFDAGKRRMVPIFLTSMTTAVGVIPMIVSKSPLWYPMGMVICYGTLAAMIMVVLIMPPVYYLIYRVHDKNTKTNE